MLFIEQRNFLSQEEKYKIDDIFWSTTNPWTYQPMTFSDLSAPSVIDLQDGYDVSYFTFDPQKESTEYEIVRSAIFKFLKLNNIIADNLIRIKFNITPVHDVIKQSPPHCDSRRPHLNFIYYLNDSEGETVIYNEVSNFNTSVSNPTIFKKIKPESGKAILFDGRNFHSVTPPSKMPLRGVINALIELKEWPSI